jgi:glycosyltransferase involved in cell wall biosynthesis
MPLTNMPVKHDTPANPGASANHDAFANRSVPADHGAPVNHKTPASRPPASYGLCYVCDEYPPVVRAYGGLGTAFCEQAEAFARRGRRVDVICRTADGEPGVRWINGVRVHIVRPCIVPKIRALVDRFHLTTIVRRLCATPADIVITAEYAGPFIVKRFRNPLVVQIEGAMTVMALTQDRPARRLARYCERRTVDLADELFAVSRFAAKATLEALGARQRQVHVFPNSVDAARFHPEPAAVDPDRVLFVGKMNRLKGLYVLAEAMRGLFARSASAMLTLIGGDHVEEGESCLTRFLASFDPADRARVRVTGRLSRADVAREIRQCGVLVLPSLTEMCPVVMLEAMSSGRPVVASNRGGIPEMLRDGETGLLADPDHPETFADALARLLADRPMADAMGAAGREAVLSTYTSEQVVDGLQQFYDALSGAAAREAGVS